MYVFLIDVSLSTLSTKEVGFVTKSVNGALNKICTYIDKVLTIQVFSFFKPQFDKVSAFKCLLCISMATM